MGMAAPTHNQRMTSDEEVYRDCAADLVRFATGLVGPSDAHDVVSAAVLRSISSRTWSTVSDRRAYLYRAVLNQAKNEHRDRQRRWAKELRAASDSRSYLPEYRPEVLTAVRRLSLRQRAVIILHYWEDLSPTDVAERLGISDGSVRRHLARARSKLRRILDE